MGYCRERNRDRDRDRDRDVFICRKVNRFRDRDYDYWDDCDDRRRDKYDCRHRFWF